MGEYESVISHELIHCFVLGDNFFYWSVLIQDFCSLSPTYEAHDIHELEFLVARAVPVPYIQIAKINRQPPTDRCKDNLPGGVFCRSIARKCHRCCCTLVYGIHSQDVQYVWWFGLAPWYSTPKKGSTPPIEERVEARPDLVWALLAFSRSRYSILGTRCNTKYYQ